MKGKLIFTEIVLLLASVLVFRGAWLLMDTQDIMEEPLMLGLSLVIGTVVAIFCFDYIIRHRKKQQ